MKKFVMFTLFAALILSTNSVLAKTYTCRDGSVFFTGFNPDKNQECLNAKKVSKAAYQICLEQQKMMNDAYDYDKGMSLLKQGKCFEELEVKQSYGSGSCSIYYINKDGKKLYFGNSTDNLDSPDSDACINSLIKKYSITKNQKK